MSPFFSVTGSGPMAEPLSVGLFEPSTCATTKPCVRLVIAATATPGLPMVVTTFTSGTSRPAAAPDSTLMLALSAASLVAPRVAPGATFEKTMIIKPGMVPPLPPKAAPAPGGAGNAPAGAPAMSTAARPAEAPAAGGTASIKVLSGAAAGREVPLVKVVTTIGKPGVAVAAITKRSHGFVVAHVEGSNKPTLNGAAIGAEPVALKNGDMLELAGTQMQFLQAG